MVLLRSLCRRAGASLVRLVSASGLLVTSLTAPAAAAPLWISKAAAGQNCVAVTFDDGPDPRLTPQLLSILEQKRAPATFFVMGSHAAAHPEIVARAKQDGNEIGNHSWDHPYLNQIAGEEAKRQLDRTDDVIASITGERPKVTRPPYGKLTESVVAAVGPRTFVNWSVDTRDWEFPDVDRIVNAAVGGATDGAIILLHDIHPRSIEAVPAIIDGLRSRGFKLGTVSELLSGTCGDAGGWGIFTAWAPMPAPTVRAVTAAPAAIPAAKPTATQTVTVASVAGGKGPIAQPGLQPSEPLFPILGRLLGRTAATP